MRMSKDVRILHENQKRKEILLPYEKISIASFCRYLIECILPTTTSHAAMV